MAAPTDEISVNPQIMLLEQVLGEIAAGRIRVPRFQRPFVWRPEQMLSLFDSIERGYPIGSLLIWDTITHIPSLDKIADIDIPSAPSGEIGYVLDGHQRLSTLFGSLLQRPSRSTPHTQQAWMWDVYRVLGSRVGRADPFRHWTKAAEPPPADYLPMRSVLKTMDFLAYSRRLNEMLFGSEELIEEAEQLAHRIKSYQVAVVRLKGGDLRHAVEVFSRLNSSGQSMTPDQMVSALTYHGEGESLADRIEAIREDLGGIGYGDVPTITIFRSVLAVAGESDVQNARWERLAERVKGDLERSVQQTDRALRLAIEFLRERAVPLNLLLPYQLQLMLLTACFHENPDLSPAQRDELERWFWGTSWSGYFAGANTTQVRQDLGRMKQFARGKVPSPWDSEPARAFPDRFDFRSARVRAFLLWEIREYPIRVDADGRDIDPVELLARSHTATYSHVTRGVPQASHPANRLIFPTRPGVSVRAALMNLRPGIAEKVMASHGIPPSALQSLQSRDDEGFIIKRAELLITKERSFMAQMGIEPAEELGGETDIDTE